MALNRTRFQNAVLYFLHESNPAVMGRVKLMKLLYYLDFDHLERYRRSVTGDGYIHLEHGPVPRSAWDVIASMDGNMLCIEHEHIGLPNPRHVFKPLVPYDLSVFSDSERAVLISVNEKWRDATGAEIELASHQELPWLSTREKQEVPKITAFRRRPAEPPSPELREQMLQSIVSSLSKEGVDVPEEQARRIFDAVTNEYWSEARSPV